MLLFKEMFQSDGKQSRKSSMKQYHAITKETRMALNGG